MTTNSRGDLPTRALSLRLGLKFVGERALTPDEIVELEREAHKYQKQSTLFGWLIFLGVVLPFFLIFLSSLLFPGGNSPSHDAITERSVQILLVLSLSIWVPSAGLRDEGQRRGKLGVVRDLRAGGILQFEGHAREFKDRRFATRFFAKNSAVSSDATMHLIEVLPYAQRLWKIDGVIVAPWKVLDRIPKPEAPMGVAIDEVLASDSPKTLPSNIPFEVGGERELTAIECRELEQRLNAPSASKIYFQSGIGWMLTLGVLQLFKHFYYSKPFNVTPDYLVYPGISLLFGALASLKPRDDKQLRRDFDGRHVLKVRIPTSPHALPVSQRAGIELEILPNTRWIWTSEEHPPAWRAKPQQKGFRVWKKAT